MYNFNENEIMPLVRTKWSQIHNHKTTFNAGLLIPVYRKEILPKDFIKLNVATLIKMTTPNFQTMDQAFCDIHFYFIPNRLLWKHWKQFQGERNVGPHEIQPEYTMPQTTAPEGGWEENTIADYLRIPTKVQNLKVDSRYFRAIALVWNEWYRDQNRQDFTDFYDGDNNEDGSNGSNYVTDIIKGGMCPPVCKFHDYFTSTLLQPQAGDPVTLPLGISAPVIGNGMTLGLTNNTGLVTINDSTNSQFLKAQTNAYGKNELTNVGAGNPGTIASGTTISVTRDGTKSGIIADLSLATAATVNQIRQAFQLQKIFEANNRSGTRYIEILKNRWQVTPSDATLQRPEYLGGKRFPINIEMVVQTSATNTESPLGQISGYSNTRYDNEYFSKNFEEHGILLGFAMVRHQRTYQQGLSKIFTRRNMEDFFMPEFQNLGEQPVYNYEIFAKGDGDTTDNKVFGYQEYGAEYRYEPNGISGQFRSNATNSFDNWHYADDYADTPVNGEEWIVENKDAIDRTLTVTSQITNQFYADFSFKETLVRSMPPHSIPGFIDHH